MLSIISYLVYIQHLRGRVDYGMQRGAPPINFIKLSRLLNVQFKHYDNKYCAGLSEGAGSTKLTQPDY